MTDWKKIIAQYEAIRRLGQTNMFDKNMVQRIAYENGFYELVNAITEGLYGELLERYEELITQVQEQDIPKARPLVVGYKLKSE